MDKIAQGAEGIVYKDADSIIKERLSKGYRIPQLDDSLRQFRTRREAKILQRLEELNFPAPKLREFSDKRMTITMDHIQGEKLKDVLQHADNTEVLAKQIGSTVGFLHSKDLVHGDLTTSNMILHQETGKINFIDFGLSAFSDKVEDKAVDLFLLDRGLGSVHADLYPGIFEQVMEGYKDSNPHAAAVLERLKQVQARGRNKKKS